MRALLGITIALAAACGTGSDPVPPEPGQRGRLEGQPPISGVEGRSPSLPAKVEVPRPGALATWQPGFHQALRWEVVLGSPTTLRMRVPVARSGSQIRVAFRTGDGDATLHGATIAHAAEDGALASAPIPLHFGGASGFSAGPRTRVISDPVHFPIAFRDELYISFQVEGHLAAGAIDLFPDSWASENASPADMQLGDRSEHRAIALASVLVLGEPSRAFVAIGDSITEAFVDGRDDYRRNWPQVAEAIVGLPVVNAGVSGQGLWAALEYLDEEVLVLKDVTDCLVLLGTNDLGGVSDERLEGDLARLFDRLEPFCSVWAGTLPPKDRPEVTDEVRRQRKNINEWIRQEAEVAGVIDFEQVLAEPGHPDRWAAGLDEDGVHPSVSGQRVMGEEAARFISSEIVTR